MTEAQKAKIARQRAANGRKSAAKQKAMTEWFRLNGWTSVQHVGKPTKWAKNAQGEGLR
jgi:hypothetical protein